MLPPDPPVDYALETASGMDAVMRITWADNSMTRLTTSLIGIDLPADHVEDTAAAYYVGFPAISALPALKQVINGLSDSVEFGLPGLDAEIAAKFDAESDLADGAQVYIGKVIYDDALQLIGGARWLWVGQGGVFGLDRTGGSASDGSLNAPMRTVSLEVGTEQIIRSGSELQAWSDAQHQRLHPGDKGCERTALISQGARKQWPKF